jgi:hypothetical protein
MRAAKLRTIVRKTRRTAPLEHGGATVETSAAGLRAERRVLEALRAKRWRPDWAIGIRRATPAEDEKGQDLIVITNKGDLPIQVKNSENARVIGARARRGARRHIPLVVVRGRDLPELAVECWEMLAKSWQSRGGDA